LINGVGAGGRGLRLDKLFPYVAVDIGKYWDHLQTRNATLLPVAVATIPHWTVKVGCPILNIGRMKFFHQGFPGACHCACEE
jgi:hypothetical protein